MLTTIIFIAVLSILIVVHELGHFFAALRVKVRVEKFSLGFGPRLFKKIKGQTEYCVSAIPLGGFVKLAGDNLEEYKGKPYEYFSKSCGERFQIIFAGPLLNYLMGFIFFWLIFFFGYPTLTTKVGGLVDGFGAKEAGLQEADRITAVNGKKVTYWEDLQKLIQENRESDSAEFSVLREKKEFNIRVKIKAKEFSDPLGRKREVGIIGISPSDEVLKIRHGLIESFGLAFNKTWDLTVLTYNGLWMMITGKISMRESVTGPLGIFFITSKAANMGFLALIHFIAVLSVSLAIFNLLPLPVLDGGHIILLGLEKIRGRALNIKAERIITQIGLSLIICLAVFVTYNDIIRLYGDKISKLFK